MSVILRKFPYPYNAFVTIDSDCDNMVQSPLATHYSHVHIVPHSFEEIHKFVNTKAATIYGTGVGLDLGDSLFMYNHWSVYTGPSRYMIEASFFHGLENPSPLNAANMIKYVRAGWIDGFHSFGNFTTSNNEGLCTRDMVQYGINFLKRYGVKLETWSNHGSGNNFQNLNNKGADPQEPLYYHADITIPYGVRFVWMGLNAFNSTKNHGQENVLYPLQLQDGQNVWNYGRMDENWSVDELHLQLNQTTLDQIKTDSHYLIVGNHWGGGAGWSSSTVDAINNLASEYNSGNILVARKVRLLKYNLAEQYTGWIFNAGENKIVINSIDDPQFGSFVPNVDDVRGLTFLNVNTTTKIFIGEHEIMDIQRPANDIVMIKWFDADVTDYTRLKWRVPVNFYERLP